MRRALYREYRPRSLSEVIGQPHITAALQKSLQSGKTSHAYLFIGPRGTGKTSVARILAHEINGFKYELEEEHLDIIEIDAASNTGVDNIRSLRENAIVAPTYGKYKIYIIDEVHMLSKSAFNALLKTLEEPPEHVIFIMATTDAHKVPITITSRSQTYTFKLATTDTITAHLAAIAKSEKINIQDDALKLIAKRSGGSFRDAISLLDQLATGFTGEITCALLEDALGLPSDQLISKLLAAYSAEALTDARITLQNLLEQAIKPETIAEDMVASIIADPKPELLHLLSQLIEIPSSNRPEVKLLLALMSRQNSTNFSTGEFGTERPLQTTASTELRGGSAIRNDGGSEVEAVARDDAPAPQPSSEKSVETVQATSWPTLLDAIKKDNAPLYSLLTRANGHYADNILKIQIKNKLMRGKVDQKRTYLASFLPEDATIEITDQAPTSDPLINDLSSIFGDVEEVELEHE